MLSSATILATIAVSDIDRAKEFYGGSLGLKQTQETMGVVTYISGNGKLLVYPAQTAGTNQATSATWQVDDVASIVEELKAKGISFEHYDVPGASHEGDVHVMGPVKAAWFKDPDGNTLSIVS